MEISKLSDEQKSVLLARVQGWRIIHGVNIIWIEDPETDIQLFAVRKNPLQDGRSEEYKTLFHPKNFHLVWRVLNWATMQKSISNAGYSISDAIEEWWREMYPIELPLKVAQRAILDKILSLAIKVRDNGEVRDWIDGLKW